MSDKGDKNDDKKQSQSEIKNGVEKLIKIDKKHANFEFNDTLINAKVKIRNVNSSTSSSILGQNQPENTLRCFWRHINRYYFRKLDTNEMERLEYLEKLFSFRQDTSIPQQKYANSLLYTAFKEVFDKDKFINDPQQTIATQKIIYKIIKVNCNIQALLIECYFKDKATPKFIEQIIKEREQIYSKKTQKKKNLTELQSEYQKSKQIEEKLLKQIESSDEQDDSKSKKKNISKKKGNVHNEEDSEFSEMDDNLSTNSNDEISYYAKHSSRTLETEMERLAKQLEEVNSFNKQNQKKLSQKAQIEIKEGKLTFLENQCNTSVIENGKQLNSQSEKPASKQKKKTIKNNEYSTNHVDAETTDNLIKYSQFQKELGKDPRTKMSDQEISELHLNYLQKLIFILEEKQIAESISKLTNCRKESKKEFSYEVCFEDALNSKPIYLSEKTLLKFNEFREHSLFKQYNLPTKTLFSSTSHNLEQFIKSRNKQNQHKGSDILETMKKNTHLHHDQAHNQILKFSKNFDTCHNCRQIFDLGYLIKCNYRSSVMGMPQSNQSNNDQIFISQLVEIDNNQRRPFLNRKRNNYNSYIKKSSKNYFRTQKQIMNSNIFCLFKDGELVCRRKYCLHCLKQNYEYKHENQSKSDWVCPFCQGYCHCTRCQRNEMINKLKGIYLLYGGDTQQLEQESLLNKFLRPLSEDDRKKKEKDDVTSRQSNSSMIAHQVQKQIFEKEIQNEKDLQVKLDDLTDVRFDMEKVRLVVSQVCKREKIKHLKLQEDISVFKSKAVSRQAQKKQNLKNQIKESSQESVKSTPAKNRNGVAKNKSKNDEIDSKKKINKSTKKKSSKDESDEDVQEEDEELQSDTIDSEEEQSENSENEQSSDENSDDEEEEEVENASIQNSDEEVSSSAQSEEEVSEGSEQDQEVSELTSEIDEDEQIEEEGSDVDEGSNSEAAQTEEEEDSEVDEEEDSQTDIDEDSDKVEDSLSDENTIEKDNKKNKKQIKSKQNKQSTPKNSPKLNGKTRNQVKDSIKQEQKKKKETQINGKRKKEEKKDDKKSKNSKIEQNKNKSKKKQTKKQKKSSNKLEEITPTGINKELQNLIKNQDPSILQLTSQKEKSLRSGLIPAEQQSHENSVNNGKQSASKNNKQNISKYEQTPKKKQKI